MKRSQGSVLIELLLAVGVFGIFLSYAVLGLGDVEGRLRARRLELAGRRLLMDARGTQEFNMFAKGENALILKTTVNKEYYAIYPLTCEIVTRDSEFYFSDFGCENIYFKEKICDLTEYKPTGSVNDEKTIKLGYHDADDELFINLQPVTGRIEIAEK